MPSPSVPRTPMFGFLASCFLISQSSPLGNPPSCPQCLGTKRGMALWTRTVPAQGHHWIWRGGSVLASIGWVLMLWLLFSGMNTPPFIYPTSWWWAFVCFYHAANISHSTVNALPFIWDPHGHFCWFSGKEWKCCSCHMFSCSKCCLNTF